MSVTYSVLIGVPCTILNARTGTGASDTFALPIRSCVLGWQISYDVAPAAIDIDLEVSMDGNVWSVLDNSTDPLGEVWTVVGPTAGLFVRANVKTNTGNRAVTLLIVCKVAVP